MAYGKKNDGISRKNGHRTIEEYVSTLPNREQKIPVSEKKGRRATEPLPEGWEQKAKQHLMSYSSSSVFHADKGGLLF